MSTDWLDAKQAPPKSLAEAVQCASLLRQKTAELIKIAQQFGGTGAFVEGAGVPLRRLPSQSGSRVARFNAEHGEFIVWSNIRLTECFEVADNMDKCGEKAKMIRELSVIGDDLNALESWGRRECAPAPGASQECPDRVFTLPDNHGWQGKTRASWILGGQQEEDTNGNAKGTSKGYPQSSPAPAPDRNLAKVTELENRMQPVYARLDAVEAAIRRAVQVGFAPDGYMIIKKQRAELKDVGFDLQDAVDKIDEMDWTNSNLQTRKQRRAISQKLIEEIDEALTLDKQLEQLTHLFSTLRV